jgi:hypothetical protein
MATPDTIRFALTRIITEEFAIIENIFMPGEKVTVVSNLVLNFAEDEQLIAITGKFTYEMQEKVFLVVAVSLHFKIFEEDWKRMFDEKELTLTLKKNPALHLASLTVGTARGVIHAKTEGHPVNAVVLPTINLNEMISDDLVMKRPK